LRSSRVAQRVTPVGSPATAPKTMRVRLEKLGLAGDADLALHLPLRYEDETRVIPIVRAAMGESVQVEGLVVDCKIQYRPRRQLFVRIRDDSGELGLRFLNFYGSQIKHFVTGTRVRARGEMRDSFLGPEMIHPRYSVVSLTTPLPDCLTPIYPAGEGVSQSVLKKAIAGALGRVDLSDTVPEEIRQRYTLWPFEKALRTLHNPAPEVSRIELAERTHPAWIRIKFDELLAQQLSLKRAREERRERTAPAFGPQESLIESLRQRLPFTLTAAQERVWHEISADLSRTYPMQRLLQGDVGSGKTVIAAMAALKAIDNGYQATLMAPTEILAEQHFQKLCEWIEALGVNVAWLTGRLQKKAKEAAYDRVRNGQARLVIGTHALIQEAVAFARLGLVIIDEQHRFGVEQRLALRAKSGLGQPHQLMMSATPIPRTLAMTYYADLEVSTIDQLPPGRLPVVTKLFGQERREEVLQRVHAAVASGQQAYWVCPLIEESEALQLQTAVETQAALNEALAGISVGLVHGRLGPQEKAGVMDGFARGAIQVLVATTVIEVGVDVPNATLMVIEHAERFGLSQLHQLRGRVGRNTSQAACILLYQSPLSQGAKERLRIMREITDGFEIARRDLALRGPGEFLGQRQSGMALLRFADLETDQWLVEQARDAADWLLRDYAEHGERHLMRWLGRRADFLKA